MENQDTISTQISTGVSVIRKLITPSNPNITYNPRIMGGAPRNWYLGKPAIDIDVFFTVKVKKVDKTLSLKRLLDLFSASVHVDFEHIEADLNSRGFNVSSGTPDGLYDGNPNLIFVWDCTFEGQKINFIWVTEDHSIDDFVYSTSKAWYNHSTGGVQFTQDFKLSHRHKVHVQTGKKYMNGEKYDAKMKAYFPDYRFVDKAEVYDLFFKE